MKKREAKRLLPGDVIELKHRGVVDDPLTVVSVQKVYRITFRDKDGYEFHGYHDEFKRPTNVE